MSGEEGAIRELLATWKRATREGNVQALLDMLTDDVVFLTPGNAPFGKKQFEAGFLQVSVQSRIDVEQQVEELRCVGDFAYALSFLRVTVTPKVGGNGVNTEGHVLSVFRKEGGRWKIARDANLMPQAGNPNKV
ncbi:MAG TPA: SgcJ/EcaC family oxidoreductase [Usitatibacter sp.]|nr:SgcJ/EcaC family oxidoreductase [Usitatibacter sp.]